MKTLIRSTLVTAAVAIIAPLLSAQAQTGIQRSGGTRVAPRSGDEQRVETVEEAQVVEEKAEERQSRRARLRRAADVGTEVRRLSTQARRVVIRDREYYVDRDVYYIPRVERDRSVRFIIARPPVGVEIGWLPDSYLRIRVGGRFYFVSNDVFYEEFETLGRVSYRVIDPPVGAWVYRLPDPVEVVIIGGERLYRCGGLHFRRTHRDGKAVYVRVRVIDPSIERLPPRITGRLIIRDRRDLPPDAFAIVRLFEVERPGVKRSIVERRMDLSGRNELEFSLDYDDALIDPVRTYQVEATVFIDRREAFTTQDAYTVITRGASRRCDLVLIRR